MTCKICSKSIQNGDSIFRIIPCSIKNNETLYSFDNDFSAHKLCIENILNSNQADINIKRNDILGVLGI